MPRVKYDADCNRRQDFRVCIVDAIEFTSVCFLILLQPFIFRQKCQSLKSLYEFWSLASSVLNVSS
jgi:hypothetical protein